MEWGGGRRGLYITARTGREGLQFTEGTEGVLITRETGGELQFTKKTGGGASTHYRGNLGRKIPRYKEK